jgi:hypothetical protein
MSLNEFQTPIHPPDIDLPSGIIPQVDARATHQAFIETVQPPYALVKITDADKIVSTSGATASEYFSPRTDIITTTTINDTELQNLDVNDEYGIIQRFEPDFHLPADRSVYIDQSRSERKAQVKRNLKATLQLHEQLQREPDVFSSDPPTLIPLIKGITTDDRRPYYQVFDDYGVRIASFYATQYFTNDGPEKDTLIQELNQIDHHSPDSLSLLVAGSLGQKVLESYPESVKAATGLTQWYQRLTPAYDTTTNPTSLPIDDAHTHYHEFARSINDCLNVSAPVSQREEWDDR